MKRVEQLIDSARKRSGNSRYDADSGVPQSVFVEYLQAAQQYVVTAAVNTKSKILQTVKIIDVVPSQAYYSYPSNLYISMVDTVEWSSDGITWNDLFRGIAKDRLDFSGNPCSYIPQKGGFILNSVAISGKLRITYTMNPNQPQKRSGQIQSVSIVGGSVTALTLDISEASYDETEINSDYFLCVVDKYGNQKAANIPYDSVTSGVFTLSSHTLSSGESIAVGDYITVGKNTTNLIELPDPCEVHLLNHTIFEAKYGDASQWSQKAQEIMAASLQGLLDSFGSNTEDFVQIPIVDDMNLLPEGW
jgi:hypothetical protein